MDMQAAAYDVIVVGSGAGGLVAALSAAVAGASVLVLEKADRFGGTSAVSGGSIWAPVNKYAAKEGIEDSREAALEYLSLNTLDYSPAATERFVDTVNPMLDLVEETTGIDLVANLDHPDYQPELPGALHGGRTLQTGLYDATRLGTVEPLLRRSHSGVPITKHELDGWGEVMLDRWDWELLSERTRRKLVGMGTALVGYLLEGCLAQGVELVTEARVREVQKMHGRVAGVVCDLRGSEVTMEARKAVILASGGFEWASDLVRRFLPVPSLAPGTPPSNEGDGLRLAMDAGAALGNLHEAWWAPMIEMVGDRYDGEPLFRSTSSIRTMPGGIIVDRSGHRFIDETMNYNDFVKVLTHFDPASYTFPHVPCWLVFDEQFRRTYTIGTATPDAPTPKWMTQGDDLAGLAAALGIDDGTLVDEVETFNRHAASGEDPKFGRGQSVFAQYRGDPDVEPHRNLRPLGPGPWYAARLELGTVGTKGGPVTDLDGRVLAARDEQPIPGLFACGNVAASPFGPGYPGAGATLASAMTFGYLAGRAAATEAVGE